MELILIGLVIWGFFWWRGNYRAYYEKADILAVASVQDTDLVGAEVMHGYFLNQAAKKYIAHVTSPFFSGPSQRDVRLLIYKVAACQDRINELQDQPHGSEYREHIRENISKQLKRFAYQLAKEAETQEMMERMHGK